MKSALGYADTSAFLSGEYFNRFQKQKFLAPSNLIKRRVEFRDLSHPNEPELHLKIFDVPNEVVKLHE